MEIDDIEDAVDGHLNIDDVQKMTVPEPEVTGLSDVSQQSNIQTTGLDDIIEPYGAQATGLGKFQMKVQIMQNKTKGPKVLGREKCHAPTEGSKSGTIVTALRQSPNIQPHLKKSRIENMRKTINVFSLML